MRRLIIDYSSILPDKGAPLPSPEPRGSRPERNASIDLLRGLAIFVMGRSISSSASALCLHTSSTRPILA